MASRERPLFVTWESDTTGVKRGAEEVVRTAEETEKRVADVSEQSRQRQVSQAESLATSLRDQFGVSNAAEFGQMAQEAAQTYIDAFAAALEAGQARIKEARNSLFGAYKEGMPPTDADILQTNLAALGNGDPIEGLKVARQMGLSLDELLNPQAAGPGSRTAQAAVDFSDSGFPAAIATMSTGVGAFAWLAGKAAEMSGLPAAARLEAAGVAAEEASQAMQYQNELLRQIAQNTAANVGGGDFGVTATYPTGG